LLLATVIAGCASRGAGPGLAPPTLGLTDTDRYAAAIEAPAPTEADLAWWRRFDDPLLAQWVERALAANVDIGLAQERVVQARALLGTARAQRGVRLAAEADAQWRVRRPSGRALQPGAALALDLDTDLWGGLRDAERAAAAGVRRDEHLVQATRLAAASLTARGYLEWQAARHDRDLLDEALALQHEALRVVSVRVEAGLSPVLDRDRAQAELASTEAERAAAGVRVGEALAALHVLAGQRPMLTWPTAGSDQAVGGEGAARREPGPYPSLEGAAPAGRPVDLLRQRPDLLAAQEALAAAAAEVGVAEAALRPRLRLPATLVFGGAMAGGALELVTAALGAAVDVTLFDGGALAAGVEAAQSRARESALVYRQALLQALQQVETALLAREGARSRIAARSRATQAARAAQAQADTLYRAGLSGYLDVVDAQRSALANRRALLQAQADAATAAVLAFEAMGLIGPAPPAPAPA
jgi:NodT family efflux transporter outer membrane factor (OMF) lipoprotein